jgi:hypothetical protein
VSAVQSGQCARRWQRYGSARHGQRSVILDEFVAVTGYERKREVAQPGLYDAAFMQFYQGCEALCGFNWKAKDRCRGQPRITASD